MVNWIKNLFKSSEKQLTKPNIITCGERDEKGICDSYVNGIKTNVRMLVFTEEEIKRIHKI